MSRHEILQLFQLFLPLIVVLLVLGIRKTEENLLERLRKKEATGPGTAAPLGRISRFARGRLRRLLAEGAVRQPEPGRYYVNESEVHAYRQRRKRLALAVIAIALTFAAAMILFLMRP